MLNLFLRDTRHFIYLVLKRRKNIYVESGEGHPLVLLHGLMGGLSNFDKMVTFFRKRDLKFMFLSFLSMICPFLIPILQVLQNM
jgi:hypothetical protein